VKDPVETRTDYLKEFVGEDLSGVTFVRDYLQLQFNPPLALNAYTPVTVRSGDRSSTFGEDAFPGLLLGQLNKLVRDVEMRLEEALIITFSDGSTIAVSLRPDHYVCAEAVHFFLKDGRWDVI
jgi:hypothetical protein